MFSPNTAGRIGEFAEIIRPGGAVTAIDEPEGLDLLPLKSKRISFHWESMFTRPLLQTDDLIAQHELLEHVARLVDAGTVRTTMTTQLGPINAATLRQAHEMVESGHSVGKTVIAGFSASAV